MRRHIHHRSRLCLAIFTIALLMTRSSDAFTLDETNPEAIRHEPSSTDGSMFGFTLAFWSKSDSSQWLLVGAPRSKKSGELFKCQLDFSNPTCQAVQVDKGTQTCQESNCNDYSYTQRLGATLTVHDNSVLTCAPNWFYTTTNLHGKRSGAPVGKCFYSEDNDMTNFQNFSPAYDMNDGNDDTLYYFTTGYCQVGFSGLLLPEKGKVALGSPGCYTWTGDLLVGNPGAKTYAKKGKSYSLSEDFGIPSPPEKVPPYDRYLGYSMARGTFGGKLVLVAGAPKETNPEFMPSLQILNSSVTLMEETGGNALTILEQLNTTPDKNWYFAYCGYSVAVGDLNGDGLDDIAVGCPNHDDDKGAVLVYYQTQETDRSFKMKLEDPEYRTGSQAGDRFGSYVTVLDDIDGDGCQELAVGSPYNSEGTTGSGRLYIYCSTRKQQLPKIPCQEVASPNINDGSGGLLTFTTFGWSATAHGSSVAVSAPSSDAVLLYRKRTVIQFNVSVDTSEQLDVTKLCFLDGGDGVPCVDIKVCVQYTLRNGPSDDRVRDMNVQVELEKLKSLYFDNGKNKTVNFLIKESVEAECKQLKVYDKKKSGEFVMYEIIATGSFTPTSDDRVVLDDRHGLKSSSMLMMKVDCEKSTYDFCYPEMRVSIQQSGQFVLGDEASVLLTVTVAVQGDPAYYPRLLVSSGGFMAESSDILVTGTTGKCLSDPDTLDFTCSLSGVLQDTTATVTLNLTGSMHFYNNLKTGDDFFTVASSASCASPIMHPSQGNDTVRIDILVQPKQLELNRVMIPEGLDLTSWNTADNGSLASKGPFMLHTYKVNNPNDYSLYGVSLTIYWPQRHNEGYLLYTIDAPVIMRGSEAVGRCVAVAGGAFDEENFNNSSSMRGKSTKASRFSGSQLGSLNIQPLEINCDIGELDKDSIIDVTVKSYAFIETFNKLKDNKIHQISSVGVARPQTAALGKPFDVTTELTIPNIVTYPKDPFQWWWYLIGGLAGLIILIIMGVVFYQKCIKKKDEVDADTVDGVDGPDADRVDGVDGEEIELLAGKKVEEGGRKGENDPPDQDEGDTAVFQA